MRGHRNIYLLHCMAEENKEDTFKVVAEVLKARFYLADFKPVICFIKSCHRMGRSSNLGKPRPILMKLHDVELRNTKWYSKTKLKGSVL